MFAFTCVLRYVNLDIVLATTLTLDTRIIRVWPCIRVRLNDRGITVR
jgi:hypothetical protein